MSSEAFDKWYAGYDDMNDYETGMKDAYAAGAASKQAEIDGWKNRAEQAEVQLAGCATAAMGWNENPAKQGDYGYSASYQEVLNLRHKWESQQKILAITEAQLALAKSDIAELRQDSPYGAKCG